MISGTGVKPRLDVLVAKSEADLKLLLNRINTSNDHAIFTEALVDFRTVLDGKKGKLTSSSLKYNLIFSKVIVFSYVFR